MSELEDRISSILNDPEQMDKITAMAQKLMGGTQDKSGDIPGLDPSVLGRLGSIMNSGSDDKTALLEAMKPYLSQKRRNKMDKALKVAKIARIARLAMDEGGEGGA